MTNAVEDRFTRINELVLFLNRPVLSHEDLIRYLTLKTFSSFGAYAIYIMTLNSNGMVELLQSFGQSEEQMAGWKSIPLTAEVPGTDAIREDRLVWLADITDWEESYPGSKNYPGSENLKTLINSPIYLSSAPVGVMGIMCDQIILPETQEIAFVDIVSGLVSLHLSKSHQAVEAVTDRKKYLTPRQIEVLKMIGDQMSNTEIAAQMGYSVSTIRHETMRIYELLKASGRRDAVHIAKQHNII
jgi:DNA-binding CsgD family transcriptional regulator